MRTICQTTVRHWRGPVGAAGFKEKGGNVVVPAFIMSATSCLRSLPRQQTLLHLITDMVKGQLEIDIFETDHTAWSNVVGEVAEILMKYYQSEASQ
jgi:hypothetical protein